jgi:protein-S-isoprenylcysteine O-methyltransferase Ste14
MNAELKSKLYDLAAAGPLLACYGFGVCAQFSLLLQTLESGGGRLEICSQLSNIVFLGLLMTLLVIRRPPVRKARGIVPRVAAVFGLLAPIFVLALPKAKLTLATITFSSVMTLAGVVASIAICLWLGRSFSVFPQARALVTTGPYRLVRHPLYVAELTALFGCVWALEAPWSLVVMCVAIAAQLPRMHFEEQVLTEAFPSYRDYASRTARLVPGLY